MGDSLPQFSGELSIRVSGMWRYAAELVFPDVEGT